MDLIQLRAKRINDSEFLGLAKELFSLFKKAQKPFLVNDRADIACLIKADGLHLGKSDLPESEARTLTGEQAILGKTIHTLDDLRQTNQNIIDYLGVGPFFASKTKQNNRPPLRKNEISQIIAKTKKVTFAIGGINRYNIGSVLKYRIKNVALASAVLASPAPRKEIEEIKKCLKKAF